MHRVDCDVIVDLTVEQATFVMLTMYDGIRQRSSYVLVSPWELSPESGIWFADWFPKILGFAKWFLLGSLEGTFVVGMLLVLASWTNFQSSISFLFSRFTCVHLLEQVEKHLPRT